MGDGDAELHTLLRQHLTLAREIAGEALAGIPDDYKASGSPSINKGAIKLYANMVCLIVA
jgi:hypothetical protein